MVFSRVVLFVCCVGFLVSSVSGGFTGDAICDYIDSNLQCANGPCDCDSKEDGFCDVCQAGQGCSKCEIGYWKRDAYSKCWLCDEMDDCSHCTDTTGCQQCDSGCTRSKNKCGVFYCDCIGTPRTPAPSDKPTSSPVNLAEEIEALRGSYDEFWGSDAGKDTLAEMQEFFDPFAEICWGGFDCSTLGEFFDNFAGICDGGSISTFSDIVFQDNRVIYSFYRACNNVAQKYGLFWINGVGITKYNDNADIIEQTVNFRDLDVLLPILQDYAENS